MAPERSTGSSITRALRVVEAVAAAGDGVTAKAIARRLSCPLPTVYRALGTLVEEGYLVRLNERRGYGLGYRIGELHRSLTDQVRPPSAVRSVVRDVHVSLGAACHLLTFREIDIVVAAVDGCAEHPLPDGLDVGEPVPAHALAAGKVLLAQLRPARVSELLGHAGAGPITSRTMVERRSLDRELLRVRAAGVAVDVEEYRPGVAGVAAPVPVRGPGGVARSAIGVSVSRADFAARRWELEVAVRAAAGQVARADHDDPRLAGQL
ncbi:IclR family transcriptional regulator [Pseudonocardia sp.]|uniref:IclR family transcriptional regulator n=1 Tax=Pseudonocardia sp. TaxID=60912 RepID=UPI002632F3CE|nr:IclR family transcriptional regulator [Pseudonocardia sp.]